MRDFPDIISSTRFVGGKTSDPNKLRIYLTNGSFLDVWLSGEGDYSYHWESTLQEGLIHRWESAPDHPHLDTSSKHFHEGSSENVLESSLSDEPEQAIVEVLNFVRKRIVKEK